MITSLMMMMMMMIIMNHDGRSNYIELPTTKINSKLVFPRPNEMITHRITSSWSSQNLIIINYTFPTNLNFSLSISSLLFTFPNHPTLPPSLSLSRPSPHLSNCILNHLFLFLLFFLCQ